MALALALASNTSGLGLGLALELGLEGHWPLAALTLMKWETFFIMT